MARWVGGVMVLSLMACAEPAGECTVSPAELDFGELESPGSAKTIPIIVSNGWGTPLQLVADPLTPPFDLVPRGPFFLDPRRDAMIKVAFTPLDGLLHLDTLQLHSADGRCELNVPLRALGTGTLRVTPDQFAFDLNPGEEETRELLIESSRRRAEDISISGVLPGSPVSVTSEHVTLQPLASVRVQVKAAPSSWEQYVTELEISTSGQRFKVPVTITSTSPRMEVTPIALDVPRVRLDQTSMIPGFVERTIRVRNSGLGAPMGTPLTIANVRTTGNLGGEVIYLDNPTGRELREGEWVEFRFRYEPLFIGPRVFTIEITPSPMSLPVARLTVSTVVENMPPCSLEVSPAGNVLPLTDARDGGLEASVTFDNVGNEVCVLDDLKLSGETFAIVSGRATQLDLPGRHQFHLVIAGPKQADAGVVGRFSFHPFVANTGVQWMDVVAP